MAPLLTNMTGTSRPSIQPRLPLQLEELPAALDKFIIIIHCRISSGSHGNARYLLGKQLLSMIDRLPESVKTVPVINVLLEICSAARCPFIVRRLLPKACAEFAGKKKLVLYASLDRIMRRSDDYEEILAFCAQQDAALYYLQFRDVDLDNAVSTPQWEKFGRQSTWEKEYLRLAQLVSTETHYYAAMHTILARWIYRISSKIRCHVSEAIMKLCSEIFVGKHVVLFCRTSPSNYQMSLLGENVINPHLVGTLLSQQTLLQSMLSVRLRVH